MSKNPANNEMFPAAEGRPPEKHDARPSTSRSAQEIETWLVEKLAEELDIPSDEIDLREPFTSYGLSSVLAVSLTGDLENWLHRSLLPTLAFDYPTIQELAQYLVEEPAADRALENVGGRETTDSEPIAVVGLGCRFPGATTPAGFWDLLDAGRDAVSEVPPDRWRVEDFYHPDPAEPNKMNTRWGGFLDDVAGFDAAFFGIAPREAARMDPQQRLLLEIYWEALEDAGQPADRLRKTPTGVFTGISTNDYLRLQLLTGEAFSNDPYSGTGASPSIASGRVSYVLGLRGPNIAVDTACSSSLVAVHLACRSLERKECNLALAGGVNLILCPEGTVYFSKLRAMSSEGRCKTFDARADGYVRGEGCGVVALKRLSDALADGDRIRAVIRGSAVNHDGPSSGLTVPNGPAQEEVIREALAVARLLPGDVSYIEAHGTGTSLGDPIEVQALAGVFGQDRDPSEPLRIGSVKTNIGHLEAAAGIAGLIKVVLALEHERVPPHLHYREPNPHIPWNDIPVTVTTDRVDWPRGARKRLAGVSSFGFSGTNAHVVLEEAPPIPLSSQSAREGEDEYRLLPLSAQSRGGLTQVVAGVRGYLDGNPGVRTSDVCYTAGARRAHLDYRVALLGRSRDEILDRLEILQAEGSRVGSRVPPNGRPRLAFVFTGQGSQWAGMGRGLLRQEKVFREMLESCDEILGSFADWSLLEELRAPGRDSNIDQTRIAQPAICAIQIGLVALLRKWGIVADAVVGHSVGEIAAAHVAGYFSLEEALRIVYHRGRLLQAASGEGRMLAVELSEPEASEKAARSGGRLSLAAVNSPSSTVLAGDPEAIRRLREELEIRGVFCHELRVRCAFHSPQMDPFREGLLESITGIAPRAARIPMISTVTGQPLPDTGPETDYWFRNIREPVRFAKSIEFLLGTGTETFLELGPHPALNAPLQQCLDSGNREGSACVLESLRRERDERGRLLAVLGSLYERGHDIDWSALYPSPGRVVSLPVYPWQKERYGLPTGGRATTRDQPPPAEPAPSEWFSEIRWELAPHPGVIGTETEPCSGYWLILADSGGVGEALSERFSEPCVAVSPGDCYEREAPLRFRVRVGVGVDLDPVFAALADDGKVGECRGVVHLWSLDAADPESDGVGALANARRLGCVSAVELIARLQEARALRRARVWFVTRGSKPVGGGVTGSGLAQSPLWGLAQVLAAEHPEHWGRLVDLDPAASPEEDAQQLETELYEPCTEDQVAYRQGSRWVPRLVPAAFSERLDRRIAWRRDASYVITGGFGDLGLATARWMIEQGARHIVLLGWTQLPPRSDWATCSAGDDRTARRVRAVRDLEALGASVHTAHVDVADPDQVLRFFDRFRSEGRPPIRGVVHAAGLIRPCPLLDTTERDLIHVSRPKVEGTWLLHENIPNETLDFVVYFSSAAAWLASPMLASYAAANAFQDSFAHYRQNRGLPAVSINWGVWEDIGLAARHEKEERGWVLPRGMEAVPPARGLAALGVLAASKAPQVGVLPVDWDTWFRFHPESQKASLLRSLAPSSERVGPETNAPSIRDEILGLPGERRSSRLESLLRDRAAAVLGMSPSELDPEQPLSYLGIDSLMAVELRNWAETALGVNVPLAYLLEGSSIRVIVTRLVEALDEEREATEPHPASTAADIGPEQAQEILDDLDGLSDEEVDRLLNKLLPVVDTAE